MHKRVKRENIALSKDNANVKRIRKKTNRRIKYHKDPLNDVINLTSKTFSFKQFELLYENLNVFQRLQYIKKRNLKMI